MAKKKITELPSATSFDGLVALGVDTKQNVSVQIPPLLRPTLFEIYNLMNTLQAI